MPQFRVVQALAKGAHVSAQQPPMPGIIMLHSAFVMRCTCSHSMYHNMEGS
jgi:hypothetical protein